MEWGTVADWVNALGTYLAFGGAAAAAGIAWRSYRSQRDQYEKDERRRRATERQEQASKVAMWVIRGQDHWYVQGVNASELPVYGLVVHLHSENPTFSMAIERGTQGPSAAGSSRKLSSALRHVLGRHDALHSDPGDVELAIAFTDTAGIRWLRDEAGILHEVDADFDFAEAHERLVDRDVATEEHHET